MVSERAGTEQSHEAEPSGDGEETFEPPAEPEYPKDGVGFDGTPVDQILEERDERLAPDNRPENSEVSNAGREFDELKGMFTDEDGYEDAEEKFDPDAV